MPLAWIDVGVAHMPVGKIRWHILDLHDTGAEWEWGLSGMGE